MSTDREMSLSERMHRIHAINQREREIVGDQVRDSVAGVVIGLFLAAVFVWGYLVAKTVEERNEAKRPAIVQVTR